MKWILVCFGILLSLLAYSQQRQCGVHHRYSEVWPPVRVETIITPRSTVYLPVVFHFVLPLHREVPTRAQILHQLDIINSDFSGYGENIYKLQTEFKNIVGNSMMQFCLASSDPDGDPTSGYTITQTSVSDIALVRGEEGRYILHYDELGGKTGWDPASYINVWVAEYGQFLGSASFPGMAPFPQEQGIIINIENFGATIESAPSVFLNRGHTLTHEMGHYFGLMHIWGQGLQSDCSDDDGIEDTPRSAGPFYGCPSGVQESCGTHNMYQNFMDLTDDRCLAAFTVQQVNLMNTIRETVYPNLGIEACGKKTDVETWWQESKWNLDVHSDALILSGEFIPDEKLDVRVFSMEGRLMHRGVWDGQFVYHINMSRVASGVYVVFLNSGIHRYERRFFLP